MSDSKRYIIILEPAGQNYSAYAPDLPGCIATGDTVDETIRNMQDAIALHIDMLREHGEPVPEPASQTSYVEVV
jgi:predicted RNase H-like HicB family nuclease